jgi:hypothetical protein
MTLGNMRDFGASGAAENKRKKPLGIGRAARCQELPGLTRFRSPLNNALLPVMFRAAAALSWVVWAKPPSAGTGARRARAAVETVLDVAETTRRWVGGDEASKQANIQEPTDQLRLLRRPLHHLTDVTYLLLFIAFQAASIRPVEATHLSLALRARRADS